MKKQLLLSLLVAMLGMYCVPLHARQEPLPHMK